MNYNSYREQMCIKQINDNKKEINKDKVKLVGASLVTGLGVLGLFYFGKEIFDNLMSNDYWNMSYRDVKIQEFLTEFPLGISFLMTYFGGDKAVDKFKSLRYNLERQKYYENNLENLREEISNNEVKKKSRS